MTELEDGQQVEQETTGVPSIDRTLEHTELPNRESDSFTHEPEHDLQKRDNVTENRTANYKDYKLCHRLKIDLPYRRRFVHTMSLFWAFVGLGWMMGQMGPSFPDLRLIVQKDLDSAAWLFTVFSIGLMIGSFVGGFLYDRFNKLLLIVFSTIITAVFTGALPWCKWFPLMIAVRFIAGLGAGSFITGGNADLVSLWDEEGRPYMQALHFCFGFGGILSPLVTEPFLAKKQCVTVNSFLNKPPVKISNESSSMTTLYLTTTNPAVMSTSSLNISSNDTSCEEVYGQTYIHYSYLISFFIIISSAIPFTVMYFKMVWSKRPHVMAADKSEIARPDKLPLKHKVVLLLLLSLLILFSSAIEDTFTGFLATFCIYHFKWSKETSSLVTSVHWAAFSFGRFLGIFLIRMFKPVHMLFVYCILLVTSFIGFTITSHTLTTELVWAFVPLAGFSMSITFPCIFTWTEERILPVSGRVSSMLLIAASLGLMLNPLLVGYLMEKLSNLWFVYLLLGESCIFLLLLFIIYTIVNNCVNESRRPRLLNIEITVPGQEMVASTNTENC